MSHVKRALIVEDESSIRKVLRRTCRKLQFDVHEAERGDEGLRLLEAGNYSLLLSDYMLPGLDGIELVARARKQNLDMPIILFTGYATVNRVVRAMQAGADHVLEKPLDIDELYTLIQRVVTKRSASEKPEESRGGRRPNLMGSNFVSSFKGPMAELFAMIDRVARTDCTVLIRGESGTGKELVARAIHERSRRSGGPFVPVNCGAIPESLIESELFGHCRGAFSGAHRDRDGRFALAHKGTIFLDEVGEMSPAFQVKLLRVLQEGIFEPVGGVKPVSADFRVIAATHRNPKAMVEEGRFREDLYYRLYVMELELPPLRSRQQDIEPLLEHFLEKFNRRHGLKVSVGDDAFLRALQSYYWPGNVREMENLIERVCILKGEGDLLADDLPPCSFRGPVSIAPETDFSLPREGLDFYRAVDGFEKSMITQAIERTNGNKNQAATILSLNRTTLVEKMKKKGMLNGRS